VGALELSSLRLRLRLRLRVTGLKAEERHQKTVCVKDWRTVIVSRGTVVVLRHRDFNFQIIWHATTKINSSIFSAIIATVLI